jgi:hypothetical protein
MRTFKTGSTRDEDKFKPDYEGYISPAVIERFGQYMTKHRVQADKTIRDSDNWQKGIPRDAYMKSMWRHFLNVWLHHRKNGKLAREVLEEALCALIFNSMGYLSELLIVNQKANRGV